MKSMITIFAATFMFALSIQAQVSDAEYIKNWNFASTTWNGIRPSNRLTVNQDSINRIVQPQAFADTIADFDPVTANFDAVWSSIPGNGYVIAKNHGLAASHNGAADFSGAFKVVYDDLNIYILLQYTDDDNSGTETVEVAWAPYFKLDGSLNPTIMDATTPRPWYQYGRFTDFGAYKATFSKDKFDAAMMVTAKADFTADINWGGTTALLNANLFIKDKTASGSNVVKRIITIGYPALTGVQRPDFNTNIWRALNNGKGISFDLKVVDKDANDALNTAATPVPAPAEYWWAAVTNNSYCVNYESGFLGLKEPVIAQNRDAEYIKNWNFASTTWNGIRPSNRLTVNQDSINRIVQPQAFADTIADFDPVTANFDAVWSSIPGNGYVIAKNHGLAASHNGAADFSGAFKVVYDDLNIYILLQYTDDDNSGTETVEVAWAPYFKLDGSLNPTIMDATTPRPWYQYGRFTDFGAYKATFSKDKFDAAMMVTAKADFTADINWGGTTALLNANLFIKDKTASGSNVVKRIITIGYPALTGVQRPDFNTNIWRALNNGKGISFDLKVVDKDANDALNTAATPVPAPAEYWWAAITNNSYCVTYESGFLGIKKSTGVRNTNFAPSIFGKRTSAMIELNETANVQIYNIAGKTITILSQVNKIDLTNFNRGVYIIKANNEVLKVVR